MKIRLSRRQLAAFLIGPVVVTPLIIIEAMRAGWVVGLAYCGVALAASGVGAFFAVRPRYSDPE